MISANFNRTYPLSASYRLVYRLQNVYLFSSIEPPLEVFKRPLLKEPLEHRCSDDQKLTILSAALTIPKIDLFFC